MDKTTEPDALSRVIIALLKGVVYLDNDPNVWQHLLDLQARVRDYVAIMGLALMLDEAEGCAWLSTLPAGKVFSLCPVSVSRRQLSYPVSLLIALLRRKLTENDALGGDNRLIINRDDIIEMLRTFLPEGSNEAKLVDRIDAYINKVVELGFIRRLRGQDNVFEVHRIMKAFVDAQWLSEFDTRLKEYRHHLQEGQSDAS